MSTLIITDAAYDVLLVTLNRAPELQVVSLVQSADVPSPDGLQRMVYPNASEAALREMGLFEHRGELEPVRWVLEAAVYSREEIPADSILEARGLAFSFPPEWQRLMNDWVLDIAGAGLVLKDDKGKTVLPIDTGQVTYYGP